MVRAWLPSRAAARTGPFRRVSKSKQPLGKQKTVPHHVGRHHSGSCLFLLEEGYYFTTGYRVSHLISWLNGSPSRGMLPVLSGCQPFTLLHHGEHCKVECNNSSRRIDHQPHCACRWPAGLCYCITFELAVRRPMDGNHTTTVDHRYRPTLAYTHLGMAMCDDLGLQLRKKHITLRRVKATMSTPSSGSRGR